MLCSNTSSPCTHKPTYVMTSVSFRFCPTVRGRISAPTWSRFFALSLLHTTATTPTPHANTLRCQAVPSHRATLLQAATPLVVPSPTHTPAGFSLSWSITPWEGHVKGLEDFYYKKPSKQQEKRLGLEDFCYKKPSKQQEKRLAWWSHKKKWKRRKESKRKMRGVALGLLDVVSKRIQSWLLFSVKEEGK